MAKYRKRPVVIEAFQMTKDAGHDNREWPEWLHVAWNREWGEVGALWAVPGTPEQSLFAIGTLEGTHDVSWDDWIIQGVEGELYPCKPEIFAKTYELVEA